MQIRERFQQKLNELRDEILKMGSMVDEELKLALSALEKLDPDLARQVFAADKAVNAVRYSIEEKCFALIVTQQPAASDLRAIVAVMIAIATQFAAPWLNRSQRQQAERPAMPPAA